MDPPGRLRTLLRAILPALLLALALAAAALLIGPALDWAPIDFCRFHTAGRMILARQSPYAQLPFFAPPWLAFLLSPLLLVPCPGAALVWILVNAAAIVASTRAVWTLARGLDRRRRLLLAGVSAVLPYALFTYMTGQLSIVALAACTLCVWGLTGRRHWPVVTGLVLATLKPHVIALPVVVVLLELMRRRQWVTVSVAAAILAALGLAAAAFVPTWPRALLASWFGRGFYEPRDNLLGLAAFGVPSWLTYPFVAYALLTWWRRRFDLHVLALAATANLLAIPYSRSYDYVLLLIPLAAAWVAQRSPRRSLALGLAVAAQLLPLVRAFAPRAGLIETLAPALCMLGLLLVSHIRWAAPPPPLGRSRPTGDRAEGREADHPSAHLEPTVGGDQPTGVRRQSHVGQPAI
jgi:hypothetical protein